MKSRLLAHPERFRCGNPADVPQLRLFEITSTAVARAELLRNCLRSICVSFHLNLLAILISLHFACICSRTVAPMHGGANSTILSDEAYWLIYGSRITRKQVADRVQCQRLRSAILRIRTTCFKRARNRSACWIGIASTSDKDGGNRQRKSHFLSSLYPLDGGRPQ